MLRFIFDIDEPVQKRLETLHSQLISCVQPLLTQLLQTNQVLMRQQLAVSKLLNGINFFRHGYYRELVDFMKDLRAKNVFNFSRCRLYEKIKKSRRFLELK